MDINKIEIGKGCFNEYVRIDNENMFKETYDEISLNENVFNKLINLLKENKDKLDCHDYFNITETIANRLENFELIKDDYNNCDQCFDFNFHKEYNKI